MYTEYLYEWLNNCLDFGITEANFWEMTLAEINRALASKKRQLENEQRIQASFDYILADMIGRSVSRVYSSSNRMPDISTMYPTLFDSEEIQHQKQVKKDELSALRFKQFVAHHNSKNNGGAIVNDG